MEKKDDHEAEMSFPNPRILISGASWAGATLARVLTKRGIPFQLVTSAPPSHQPNYISVKLFQRVCGEFDLSEEVGLRTATILRLQGRQKVETVRVTTSDDEGRIAMSPKAYGDFVLSGLGQVEDVAAKHRLSVSKDEEGLHLQLAPVGPGTTDSDQKEGSMTTTKLSSDTLLIAAEGVHSQSRKTLLPQDVQPRVLPYVVFHGKRKVPLDDFAQDLLPLFGHHTVLRFSRAGANLELKYDVRQGESYTSWTYSRAASDPHGHTDPLHRPQRSPAEATEIPPAFFEELQEFGPPADVFGAYFAPAKVKRDRVLHWLMRSMHLTQEHMQSLVDAGVVLLGDAAHPTPIVGSRGAEMAVEDALALGEALDEQGAAGHNVSNGNADLKAVARRFFDCRHRAWTAHVDSATERLGEMHRVESRDGLSVL